LQATGVEEFLARDPEVVGSADLSWCIGSSA